jgi:hypothetical protein
MYKRKEFLKSSLFSKTNPTDKDYKLKVAIQKIYFPIIPHDNMEFYLKNTEKWPP